MRCYRLQTLGMIIFCVVFIANDSDDCYYVKSPPVEPRLYLEYYALTLIIYHLFRDDRA